jgi:hypothetical protein
MQAEAGQSLDVILRRKELERILGDGVFFWGIGNSLGQTVYDFVRATPIPEVLFSVMRSRPKKEDVSPEQTYLWTKYIQDDGRPTPIPPHVLLLSRGNLSVGSIKSSHYALVCSSNLPLIRGSSLCVDITHLKNHGGNKGRLGYSQVTAIVSHTKSEMVGNSYKVAFRARLVEPYFVKLAEPQLLSKSEHQRIEMNLNANLTPNEWLSFTRELRSRFYDNVTEGK